jgi:LmbE family N-acetylglucosaminyl deacetylase
MKILAIGAHPDDLEPQIGGTLYKMILNGADVTNVIATTTKTGATYETRNDEGRSAAKIIGCSYLNLEIDQSDLNYSREYIKIFDKLLSKYEPELIFTMSKFDSHNDHQNVNKCVQSAARKNNCSIIELNQAMPGGLNTPNLNYFSDISSMIDTKYRAIECYESQINKFGPNWLEMIKARDKFWGLNINSMYAEAATITRWINK